MVYNILEFYVNKFNYLTDIDEIDINFIPSILKRRMSTVDKVCVSVLNKTFSDDIQNIIYSSQYGEVERLLKVISQYKEMKEVSPNLFSASVHNYPTGFFLFNIKKAIPYMALSACDNSISSGLLEAVISKYNNNLFCYCDVNIGKVTSFALNISKTPKDNSVKYKAVLKNSEKDDNFEDYIKFFKNDINTLNTNLFELERIS